MAPPCPDPAYSITRMYSVVDQAWCLELDRLSDRRKLLIAVVPDEDPAQTPTVCATPSEECEDIPYEVLRWYLDHVEEQVTSSRSWMELRPELVATIHQLRLEYSGYISDEDFPGVFERIRDSTSEDDLPAVLAGAFGRGPDGSVLWASPGRSGF